MPHDDSSATQLLQDLSRGDRSAGDRLLPLVYDELLGVARRLMSRQSPDHTLQSTALVHEAYLRLIDQTQPGWGSRAHFMAVAARAMRQILIDHARGKLAAKRGSDWDRVSLTGVGQDAAIPRLDLLAIDEALTRLAALSERQAQVVELKFFGGLTIDEIAGVLDVSTTAIEKNWRVARAWLSRELKGFQKS